MKEENSSFTSCDSPTTHPYKFFAGGKVRWCSNEGDATVGTASYIPQKSPPAGCRHRDHPPELMREIYASPEEQIERHHVRLCIGCGTIGISVSYEGVLGPEDIHMPRYLIERVPA